MDRLNTPLATDWKETGTDRNRRIDEEKKQNIRKEKREERRERKKERERKERKKVEEKKWNQDEAGGGESTGNKTK